MFRKMGKAGIWVISLGVVLAATAQAVTVQVLDRGTSVGWATVGIDGAGNALVAWTNPSPDELYFARYDITEGWGPKTLIDTSAISDDRIFEHVLAVNENGIALLAWTGHDGVYALTYLPGTGWQTPHVIISGDNPHLSFASGLELGIDSAGNGIFVWVNAEGQPLLRSHYTLSTDTWTEPEEIAAPAWGHPCLAVNPEGNAVLLWREGAGGGAWTLFASYFIAGEGPDAGWQPPEALLTSLGHPDPHAAINDSGEAMVVVDDPWNPALYAAMFIPGQGWQPLEEISGSDPYGAANPKVALNSSGDAVVVWQHGFDYAIFANRYITGDGWQGVEVLRASGAGSPWLRPPHINDQGNIVALWHPEAFGFPPEVEMRRFYPARGWLNIAGLPFIGTDGKVDDFSFAINSSDKSVIVWAQSTDPEGTIIFGAYGFVRPLDFVAEKLTVARQRTDGRYRLHIYDMPTDVGGNTGALIASDNNIGKKVLDIAGGECDGNTGDELMVMRGGPASTTTEKLFVYNMPTEVGGNTGRAIASDTNIGKTNRYMTVGDFDGNPDTELAVVRKATGKNLYRLVIYDLPTTMGGNTGPAIASDPSFGKSIRGVASANFDSDPEDELVVHRLKPDDTYRLQIYDAPTEVGGNTGPAIASDNNIGTNIRTTAACQSEGQCLGELYYDTGDFATPDGYLGGGDVGYAIAVRFTPPSYPWTFDLAKFWPFSGSETLDIEIHVWDDDATYGLPGSDLITPFIHHCSVTERWENVDLPSITIDSGEFYIGWVQTIADTYFNGDDDSVYADGRSYMRYPDGSWWEFRELDIYENMMIRQGCQSMEVTEAQTIVPEVAGPASKLSEW